MFERDENPSSKRLTGISLYVASHRRDLFGVGPTSRKRCHGGQSERALWKGRVLTRYIMGKSGASLQRSVENGRRSEELCECFKRNFLISKENKYLTCGSSPAQRQRAQDERGGNSRGWGLCRMVSFILNEYNRPHTLWNTPARRYNATLAINSTPATLGLTFRKKELVVYVMQWISRNFQPLWESPWK